MPNQNRPKKNEVTLVVAETLQKAMACHQAGDLANAEHGYRAILSTQPDSVDALHYLGLLEAQRERYVEALSLFDQALDIKPQSVDALVNRGNVLSALGRPRDALASYERALALDRDSAMAHFNRGNIFRELNCYEEALASYDMALAIMPENVAVLFNRSDVLQRLMRYEEALASYDRCLIFAPEIPGAMYNRGVILQQLGKHEQALASYDKALELEPNDADALNNRGNALFDLHRFDQALASYERALAVKPDFAEALNNRGNTLRELNRPEEALASCNQALAIKPGFAEAHNNLGNVLQNLGRLDEAIASFRRALALEPAFAEAHNNLGNVLRNQGRLAEAVASYRRAVELMPTSVDANINLSVALHHLVPPWHVPMMNDTRRNEAYVEALAAAVTEETTVLEIGTGSGLLAMIAARLGARQVVTCEAVSLIAATARDIVAANGWESSVSVISKMSKDVVIGVDLHQRANLLVSEILSSELLGEGVLASIEDAKRRLLEPNAKIIPATGSVVFVLLGGEAIKKNMMVDEVLGFNLSGFNAIASRKRYIHRHDLDIGLLTDTTEAFVFDFVRRDYFPAERKTLRIPITVSGCCYGVAQWIRLRLDDNVTFENHPSTKTPASSWQTCFYRFPTPIHVHPGQTAIVCAAHNRSAVWFFWEGLEG
ncbi:MAG: hypothetical protein A3F74_25450 [Betaproteobacteria bacterium RIFCSPLOWO2_12_FULL_62_58]|nr:MAG: hypothetical protein A3F74_25450 [Betaproteobacteria bacterium RIFCSPLOWO2_12_FULL_62_58]